MNTRKQSIHPKLKQTVAFAGALALMATVIPQASAGPNVKEIVRKANLVAYYNGNDGRAQVRMTVTDSQGRKRIRQFFILRRNQKAGGDQDFLVVFTRPADVRNTVFLVAKHVSRDDDRWIYLPALDLVKRISAGDKRTSFVGTHFFYEDISGRGLHEDHHKLVQTTDKHYVIEAKPKKRGDVEFSSFKVWVNKSDYVPSKMEYYDKSGKAYRRIEALEVKVIDGKPTVVKMKASDLRSGGQTITQMRGIKYDLGLPGSVFAERSLRNPPQKWLKR